MFPRAGLAVAGQNLVDHGLDPRLAHISELLRGEVDAFDQRPGINPRCALMPALNARRVIELLPHPRHLQGPIENFASRPVEFPRQP